MVRSTEKVTVDDTNFESAFFFKVKTQMFKIIIQLMMQNLKYLILKCLFC